MRAPVLDNMIQRLREGISPQSTIKATPYARNPFVTNTWYVDGQNGSNSNDGRDPMRPLLTITYALTKVRSGDFVYLTGNFAEEAGNTPKNVENVTIIGATGRPKYADAARDAKANQYGETNQNSGVSWRPPATESGTTPLITVVHQGWTFENILFVPPSDAAAVAFDHSAVSGADDGGGSYAAFRNCIFESGLTGIEVDDGGVAHMLVEDCRFGALTTGILQSTSNTGLQKLVVRNCYFMDNGTHISLAESNDANIHDNIFGPHGTKGILLSGGGENVVTKNYLSGDYDGGYVATASDEWAGNYSMDVSSGEVGAEGITIAIPVA